MFWKESSSVMQNQMTFCYHLGQLLWAASKTTLMKECMQGKHLEQEPCSAPLAMSSPGTLCRSHVAWTGKGLGHSRVNGLQEEKLITILRLKSDQIKNRLELLRSEEVGKSVLVNLTEGPYASDCSSGTRGALKTAKQHQIHSGYVGKYCVGQTGHPWRKCVRRSSEAVGRKWCHSTGRACPPLHRHKKSSREQKPTASLGGDESRQGMQ